MKPLRIFSPNLELLAEIDDYESLVITRRWHTYGEIDLVIHHDKRHVDKLVNGNILLPGNDTKSAAVIRHRESQLDTLTIKAPFLGSFMAQRVIVPTEITGPAETVMKHLVDKQAINPDNPNRLISLLEMAPDLSRGKLLTAYSNYLPLDEVLEEISRGSGLGWGVHLAGDRLVFEVLKGADHTATGQAPVIFSPDFDNVMQQMFIDSQFDVKNAVYLSRDETVLEFGDATGADRFELFASAPSGDIDLEEHVQTLMQEGVFSLEAEAISGSFLYRTDYDLGDIVTVQNKKWGIERDARITEIQEIYEPLNVQVSLMFGESPPTIIDKIKKEIRRL